ncbi:hypothetical protein Fmac_028707 [Flemingia macrophylla]|uniref:Uncharacterized protein n=1 Tax=Flemingia macrophylla TaxID=520843 RepID=A0ABD1L897_9FABA
MTTILVSVLRRSNLEWMSILRLMLQTPIADHHNSRDKALDREDDSQLLALEGKLDALVNLVTQLAANHKPASVARVCGIRSSNAHHTSVCPSSWQSRVDEHPEAYAANTYTSVETRKLEGKLDALVNLVTQLAVNQKSASIARVCGIPDHHSCRSKALDREDGSQHLALAANQKPASVARVSGIRSTNDHHTSTTTTAETRPLIAKMAPNSLQFCARNDLRLRSLPLFQEYTTSVLPMTTILVSVLLRSNLEWMSILRLILQTPIDDHHSSRDKALDREDGSQLLITTAEETRHLIEKMAPNSWQFSARNDLAANQKLTSVSRVYDIRSFNNHHTSVCPSSQQSGFNARNDAIVIRGVNDVATDTSAEARKLECKLNALVNLVTQLVVNQKPASVARVCDSLSSNDDQTSAYPSSQKSGVDDHPEAYATNTNSRPPQQGVHDVATDTSAETRKLEGKLDALVNLVTQLAVNQKPASFARVCGIRSSNDHHTSFRARNDVVVIRGVHDVATDTSAETRKLEDKLDTLVNLVTQLAANQKPASVARVCGIRSSNDHQTSFNARNDAIVIRGVHDVATDTSAETRKLEGKLDALVNWVTQLAANQKPASVARFSVRNDAIVIRVVHDVATDTSAETRKVYDIRSSNDHHTIVCPSSQQSRVDEHPEAYAANTYSRPPQQGVHDVATDTFAETRKLEGKLDALVNLVTQLAANQYSASVARVCGIRSSNDHHTVVCPSLQQSRVDEHPEAYAANTYSRPPQQGVHDVATDTFAETRKLEGKLDALVNLVTQLAANQYSASVARVCGIRSSNDHHTVVCPSLQQSRVDEHPEAYAANTYSRPPQQ